MQNMENPQAPEVEENRIEKIITHDGTFHADEVFAESVLKDLFPESMELKEGGKIDFVKYLRTRDEKLIAKALKSKSVMIIDRGGQDDIENFIIDHHQIEGAGERKNSVKYATAGLVWKYFGKEWIKYVDVYSRHSTKDKRQIGDKDWLKDIDKITKQSGLSEDEIDLIWNRIDQSYVQFIDSRDTGQLESINIELENGTELQGERFTLAELVKLYNIDVHDGKSKQQKFDEAVDIFRNMLLAMVNKEMDLVSGLRKFELRESKFLEKDRAVIIDQKLPQETTGFIIDNNKEFKKVEYYAAVNAGGSYNIMVAPVKEGLRTYRNPNKIPEELRLGTDVEKINELIGVKKGVTFVHTNGFFASCKDRDTAEKFLEYCINRAKE